MSNERCADCDDPFADDEPSVVIDGRELCLTCADIFASEPEPAPTDNAGEKHNG